MANETRRKSTPRKKKSGHRAVKKSFIIICSILLVIGVLTVLCFTTFFPVKRINVSGSKKYDKQAIIKASKLSTDDNLLLLSENKIEENIRKSLPYVDNVELKRVFPDGVILTVTDAKEQSFYKANGYYFVVSENGYVLKKQKEEPQNIFEIVTSGVQGNLGEKAVYKKSDEKELVETLKNLLVKENIKINSINVKNALQITLLVDGKFNVNLGKNDFIEDKIAHLAEMIESIGDRSGTINLSGWSPQKSQGSFVEDKS